MQTVMFQRKIIDRMNWNTTEHFFLRLIIALITPQTHSVAFLLRMNYFEFKSTYSYWCFPSPVQTLRILYVYATHLPLFDELCNTADEQLLGNIRLNASHILSSLLHPESSASQNYSLRPPVHNLQLPHYASHLVNSNFIVRMLFKNVY